jgi:hypothetical protein
VDDPTDPTDLQLAFTTPKALLVALAVVGLQVIGLLAAAAVLTTKTFDGHPDSVGRSLFGVVFALGGAAVLALSARGLFAAKRAARTPLLVMELLAIPVGYSLGFEAHRVSYGLPIFVGAVLVIALIFSPAVNKLIDTV